MNHNARYYEAYPIFVSKARRQHIWDEDGNKYTDYWMGHTALILGHSPSVVVRVVASQIENGTHYGMGNRLSLELGEEISRTVPCAEMMRFCNTGAEATMYLARLARGYTRRKTIVKMAGGWHGFSTELNRGVHQPFNGPESEGILAEEQAHVRTVRFNDLAATEKLMREEGADVAAIFLEPVLGAAGSIPADSDYLRGLRELSDRHGALLAFDEIITGFRVSLGGAQERYGVRPDLSAMGKIIGGGFPIGLVCGRREIVSLADPRRRKGFVSIGGGTFSENPMTMAAGLATIRHLRMNRLAIYARLEKMGVELRREVDSAFQRNGIQATTTGMGSLFLTHFSAEPRNAQEAARTDKRQSSRFAAALMGKEVFMLPGHSGAISTAHSHEDIGRFVVAAEAFGETERSERKS